MFFLTKMIVYTQLCAVYIFTMWFACPTNNRVNFSCNSNQYCVDDHDMSSGGVL